jgi:phosphatidylglycerol:prolipoprotein diacylglycerol transferase
MNISPVIFEIGPIQLRWYGVMYLLGYVLGGYILTVLSKKGFFKIPKDKIDPYIAYLLGGMVVGARLAYVFIYNWPYYAHHLDEIIAVWKGGLSFHGAVAGNVFFYLALCSQSSSFTFFKFQIVSLLRGLLVCF